MPMPYNQRHYQAVHLPRNFLSTQKKIKHIGKADGNNKARIDEDIDEDKHY